MENNTSCEKSFRLVSPEQALKKVTKRKGPGAVLIGRKDKDNPQLDIWGTPKNFLAISDSVYEEIVRSVKREYGKILRNITRSLFIEVSMKKFSGQFPVTFGVPIVNLIVERILSSSNKTIVSCLLAFHSIKNPCRATEELLHTVVSLASGNEHASDEFAGICWKIKVEIPNIASMINVRQNRDDDLSPQKPLYISGSELNVLIGLGEKGGARGKEIILFKEYPCHGLLPFSGLSRESFEKFVLEYNICN